MFLQWMVTSFTPVRFVNIFIYVISEDLIQSSLLEYKVFNLKFEISFRLRGASWT